MRSGEKKQSCTLFIYGNKNNHVHFFFPKSRITRPLWVGMSKKHTHMISIALSDQTHQLFFGPQNFQKIWNVTKSMKFQKNGILIFLEFQKNAAEKMFQRRSAARPAKACGIRVPSRNRAVLPWSEMFEMRIPKFPKNAQNSKKSDNFPKNQGRFQKN